MNYGMIYGVLSAAKNLISDPKRWTSRSELLSDNCHCVVTALFKMAPSLEVYQKAHQTFMKANDVSCVAAFNDSHTHTEVMSAMDKAIDYAQQRIYVPEVITHAVD